MKRFKNLFFSLRKCSWCNKSRKKENHSLDNYCSIKCEEEHKIYLKYFKEKS